MHAAADIAGRIWRAALLRKAPLWLAGVLPWVALGSSAGLLAWIAFCAWDCLRLRRRVTRNWTRWLNHAVPQLEDSAALLAHADAPLARLQQQRLLARLDAAFAARDVRRLARRRIPLGAHWLALGVVAAAVLWVLRVPPAAALASTPAAQAVAALAARPELLVRVVPPTYTGLAPAASAPRDLQVAQNSLVEWCLKNGQGQAETIELSDGQALAAGAGCARWHATESVFWRWRGARYNLRVTPDVAPQITVSKPAEMVQVLAQGAASAGIAVAVRDDYRVERATLHLTLARGSGENIRFTDREMPLPASNDPRVRSWSKQWALADLGMEPGDELYFFVRATDNAPRPQMVQSATYTLRLPGPPAAEDEESSALPTLVKPENLRSQRQIIIDTEQLLADTKARKLAAAVVRERSEAIASDQAQLRRRYGQFLGEESTLFGGDDHGDEHQAGAKQDVVAEFGHAHDQAENATMFDDATKKVLRRALAAMWDAEKALRAITPRVALAPEHKALEAIKELQQADRIYLHKTAFAPPPIKEEIRMTGDVVGAASYKRPQGEAPEAVPAQVRELIEMLSADGALPALWTRSAHDWVRERISNDEQRLAAQRAIQDVADGCAACRPALRAWLRGAITQAPVLMQARPVADTPFAKNWRAGAAR